MRTNPLRHRHHFAHGFTAIELTAVASIIALLTLILVPIVRNRVNESRKVATNGDMKTLADGEKLAFADAGSYFRLHDLDNVAADSGILFDSSAALVDVTEALASVPRAYWNRVNADIFNVPVTQARFTHIARTWNGPYTTFNETKFELLTLLTITHNNFFRTVSSAGSSSVGTGPILLIDGSTDDDSDLDPPSSGRYPVDAWGTPFLFFGAGRVSDPLGGQTAISTGSETNFRIAVIYSLGPDGLVGDGIPFGAGGINLFRESGLIGLGDDQILIF